MHHNNFAANFLSGIEKTPSLGWVTSNVEESLNLPYQLCAFWAEVVFSSTNFTSKRTNVTWSENCILREEYILKIIDAQGIFQHKSDKSHAEQIVATTSNFCSGIYGKSYFWK
jgi:hypothetical protein